jgi:hypothetical protein
MTPTHKFKLRILFRFLDKGERKKERKKERGKPLQMVSRYTRNFSRQDPSETGMEKGRKTNNGAMVHGLRKEKRGRKIF